MAQLLAKKSRRYVVLRNTPDWAENAELWQKQRRIDPARFIPDPLPPYFPENTVHLIELWNNMYAVDFFTVRKNIKDIALQQYSKLNIDGVISQFEFENNCENIKRNAVLFFSDDDDFASPDLFDQLEPRLKTTGCARWPSPVIAETLWNRRVEAFLPHFRLWLQKQIILRPNKLGFLMPYIEGKYNLPHAKNTPSEFLFQTNNYAVNLTYLSANKAVKFIDHVHASSAQRKYGLKLHTLENQYLSAANKLPSSITMFRNLVRDTQEDQTLIAAQNRDYIEKALNNDLPDELDWARPIRDETFTMLKEATKQKSESAC